MMMAARMMPNAENAPATESGFMHQWAQSAVEASKATFPGRLSATMLHKLLSESCKSLPFARRKHTSISMLCNTSRITVKMQWLYVYYSRMMSDLVGVLCAASQPEKDVASPSTPTICSPKGNR